MVVIESNELENTYVEFGGVQVGVRTNIAEVTRFVREAHSAMLTSVAPNCVETIDVLRRPGQYLVGSTTYENDAPPSSLFDQILQKILRAFESARADLLWIHAGVVQLGDAAMVIAGASANGKSTLVRNLTKHDWSFLSDEAAPIDIDTLTVTPYPRAPMWRKHPGRALQANEIGTLEREMSAVPEISDVGKPVQVGSILFTTFEAEARTTIARLNPAEASLRLLSGVRNLKAHPAEFVEAVANLVSALPCHSVTFSDGKQAARRLDNLGPALFL